MLPGTADVSGRADASEPVGASRAAGLGSAAGLSAVAGLEVSARALEGDVRGRARAAAHVTAIEEARYPRMPLIVDIVILICPSRT
ncbi:hypothetical protein GCM10010307_37010 [Streptomyces vastus]|uniref:Uncharacterized protein n=1 Tax=Streptomyces vastus TaxID=285451 RepID=A0ABP6DE95_9ACTN